MQAGLGMRYQFMTATRADQEEAEGVYSMVLAASEDPRGKDYEIDLQGIKFDNYMQNPVVLWAHDQGVNPFSSGTPAGGIPVAKTLEIGHDDGGRLVTSFQFNSGDPFASRVENAWRGGFIRAASIGFLPTKMSELPQDSASGRSYRIEEADLVEWSFVPIPADAAAVREAAQALNLPEELFRVLEPDQASHTFLPTLEQAAPSDGLLRELIELASPLFHRLKTRVDALERKVWAQEALKAEADPQPSPEPSNAPDPSLAALVADLAAMRQLIEER